MEPSIPVRSPACEDSVEQARALAHYRSIRLGNRAVAGEIGISVRAFASFTKGKPPGSRVRAKVLAWFACADQLPVPPPLRRAEEDETMVWLSIDVFCEDLPNQDAWLGRGLLLLILIEIYQARALPERRALQKLLRYVRDVLGETDLDALSQIAHDTVTATFHGQQFR